LHRASLAERLGVIVPPAALHSAVDAVLSVRGSYLDAALAATTHRYGSIDRYLESEAGLDASRREQLRARLLW
jgi:protein tyrosine/serine phosphatase